MIVHTLFLNFPLAWCIKSYLGTIVLGAFVLSASDISLHGFGNKKPNYETHQIETVRPIEAGECDQDWW